MKQKEEIANQQETIRMQIDKVNENRLELAKQSRYVRANEEIIQSQEEKIKQQDTELHLQRKSGRQYILSVIISTKMQRKPCRKRLTGCWLWKQADKKCSWAK